MEADSQPEREGWLTEIYRSIVYNRPFAVLGSKYLGHNWDDFRDQLPVALQHHLNGNAIYNVTHPTLRAISDIFDSETRSINISTSAISSFDVRIAEILLDTSRGNLDFDISSLSERGYKETGVIANYAGTLRALPDQRHTAAVVHGANDFINWNDLGTEIKGSSIGLIITDWGVGDGSGDTVPQNNNSQLGDIQGILNSCVGELNHGRFPFTTVSVMTPSTWVLQIVKEKYPESFHGTLRGSHKSGAALGTWDLCDALPTITEDWFMLTNAHHVLHTPFSLPVSLDSKTKKLKPLVPYILNTSKYCGPKCSARIDAANEQWGSWRTDVNKQTGYMHDVAELNVVFETVRARKYCADLESTNLSRSTIPTANGYFQHSWIGTTVDDMYTFYNREKLGLIKAFSPRPGGAEKKEYKHRNRRGEIDCDKTDTSFNCISSTKTTSSPHEENCNDIITIDDADGPPAVYITGPPLHQRVDTNDSIKHIPLSVGGGFMFGMSSLKGGHVSSVFFAPVFRAPGNRKVLVSYKPGESRSTAVRYTVFHGDGMTTMTLNQQSVPNTTVSAAVLDTERGPERLYTSLGTFSFPAGIEQAGVMVSTESDGTNVGKKVIVDAVLFVNDCTPNLVTPHLEVGKISGTVDSNVRAPATSTALITFGGVSLGLFVAGLLIVTGVAIVRKKRGSHAMVLWNANPAKPTNQQSLKDLRDVIKTSREPSTVFLGDDDAINLKSTGDVSWDGGSIAL